MTKVEDHLLRVRIAPLGHRVGMRDAYQFTIRPTLGSYCADACARCLRSRIERRAGRAYGLLRAVASLDAAEPLGTGGPVWAGDLPKIS